MRFWKFAFWLYLWGIETSPYGDWKNLACLNFDSTYEELKLIFHNVSLFIFYHFDSTYEELKHNNIYFDSIEELKNFDSTYEELKLFLFHSMG